MKVIVPVQLVPDLVEELGIDAGGKALDAMYLRWILNEFDDHAIEQAILLKEKSGDAKSVVVAVVAPDIEGADDALFTAAAKGADRLVKVSAGFEDGYNTHALARLYLPIVKAAQADLILTGVVSPILRLRSFCPANICTFVTGRTLYALNFLCRLAVS